MVVSVKVIKDFFLLLDHSLDAAKLEPNGENFYFTKTHLTKLRRFNKEFTVPKPNDLSVSLKALTDELIRGTDTIPVFLSYIKMLYKQRWETTLQRCDASEILNASLTNSLWIALTDGFEALLGRAFALNLISEQQYKKMPLVLRAGVPSNTILQLDRFELFYPGLKRHYELSIDSYTADTGFFWMPDLKDLKPDSNSYLPVRLYKPSEEVLLRKNYGPGLAVYLDYFVTSERSEPPIMRETFEKLRGLVEEALLFEYTVTRDTHLDEIRQLIGRQTENEWLNEKAVAIKEHLPKIKDSLKSLSEEDPKKEQLAKYIRFREAGTYDSNYEIVGDLKKVLLVACSVREKVDVSVLEELMSQAVSRKLANLTSAEIFAGEKDLQDEKLNEFTKKFVEKLSTMEGWPGGRAEMKRLRNQVLHLEGVPIDNQVMTYATFGRLVYLMAPSNQVASACAHTIWRSFLLGLMTDYMPERRFDERLERRFDGRLEDEIGLPEMRERSRNRVFYVPLTNVSCFSSIAFDGRDMRPAKDSPSSSQRASPYHTLMEWARKSGKDGGSIPRSRSLDNFMPVPVPVPVPVPGKG